MKFRSCHCALIIVLYLPVSENTTVVPCVAATVLFMEVVVVVLVVFSVVKCVSLSVVVRAMHTVTFQHFSKRCNTLLLVLTLCGATWVGACSSLGSGGSRFRDG